jgi:hypothetical protein
VGDIAGGDRPFLAIGLIDDGQPAASVNAGGGAD